MRCSNERCSKRGKGAGDMNDNNKLQERDRRGGNTEDGEGRDNCNDAVGDRHGACHTSTEYVLTSSRNRLDRLRVRMGRRGCTLAPQRRRPVAWARRALGGRWRASSSRCLNSSKSAGKTRRTLYRHSLLL